MPIAIAIAMALGPWNLGTICNFIIVPEHLLNQKNKGLQRTYRSGCWVADLFSHLYLMTLPGWAQNLLSSYFPVLSCHCAVAMAHASGAASSMSQVLVQPFHRPTLSLNRIGKIVTHLHTFVLF